MTPRLQVERVTVRLGESDVVCALSLEVEAGELVVLAGPSGSGKSSLLRAIAGLVPLHEGDIRVGGRSVAALPPGARGVAMVFQSYALLPHLTVRENLEFGLRARGRRADARRQAEEAAAALELGSLLERLPRQLSGGERQRVALARALVHHPEVFLLDEPLSSLDAPLRTRARAEIARLHRQLRAASVYVTHDQAEALALADRLGILREGRLEQIGPPLELYRRPRNRFVARFLGNPSMNLLDVAAAPPDAVAWGDQRVPLPESLRPGLASGRALQLGVRPEHLHPAGSRWAPPLAGAPVLRSRVERLEAAGDQNFLWLDGGDAPLAARVEPDFSARAGDAVELALDPAGLHLFDAENGERLA